MVMEILIHVLFSFTYSCSAKHTHHSKKLHTSLKKVTHITQKSHTHTHTHTHLAGFPLLAECPGAGIELTQIVSILVPS